jgi:hypothetical protein
MREPRRVIVFQCYDCGWVGNRPKVHEGVQYGWEEPWDEPYCPECGECVGAEFVADEVLDA